jgi:hypothetical protein
MPFFLLKKNREFYVSGGWAASPTASRLAVTRCLMVSDDANEQEDSEGGVFGRVASWRLLQGVIEVAKRVVSKDVVRFGILNIPASILGSAVDNDNVVAEDVEALTKLNEDSRGESKTMFESAGSTTDLLPNILLRPLHGGDSSEYTIIRKGPVNFFWQIFRPVGSVLTPRPKPTLFWDDGKDGNHDLVEDPARPFNKTEQWVFVNGMAITEPLALRNTQDLANMFNSRFLCVHNPTKGIVPDLLECASDLADSTERPEMQMETFGDAANVLSDTLKKIIQDDEVDTVRLICHSQGTILATCAVEMLQKDTGVRELLPKKLHAYLFANCGDETNWIPLYNPAAVEYFRNEFDFVSELGRPFPPVDSTFQRAGFYGHMLGEHYFPGFNRGSYVNENGKQSTLYGLIKHNIFDK